MLNDRPVFPWEGASMGDDSIPKDLLFHELLTRAERGEDLADLWDEFESVGEGPDANFRYLEILARLEATLPAENPAEPSALSDILALLPPARLFPVDPSTLEDKIRGGWIGRVAGNMLGKPVEFGSWWTFERLNRYLDEVDSLPLVNYIPVDASIADQIGMLPNWQETTLGRVSGSSRDDDIDYTLLNLAVLERHGRSFSSDDIARTWLQTLPYHATYTAERATYRRLVLGESADNASERENPYREWIGALIRADVFGYTNPGNPRAAALMAWRDAYLSHRQNGIYGAMWVAALVSAAFSINDPVVLIETSLDHIPPHSLIADEVRTVLDAFLNGESWQDTVERVHARHVDLNWVHVLNNAGVITAGLLWGEADFTTTIGLTVRGGLDTDSNGATAGSVAGVMNGSSGIDPRWTEPLEGRLRSALSAFDGISIDEVVARTLALVDSSHSFKGASKDD